MMSVKIFIFILFGLVVKSVFVNSDEEYTDSIINMLFNGESFEFENSEEKGEEHDSEEDIKLIGGVWKCGNCADATDSKLVYSEVNDVDTDDANDLPIEVQITLLIPSMTCVAVVGAQPGVVRGVSGACTGSHVTLSVTASKHFTVNVYSV